MENEKVTTKKLKDDRFKDLKGMIILYGSPDSGKTSTLRKVINTLYGSTWVDSIYQDAKLILKYNGKYIYFSTMGDDKSSTLDSINLFEGTFNIGNSRVWLIEQGNNMPARIKDAKELLKYPPSLFVTASHEDDATVSMLSGYANAMLKKFSTAVIWLRKQKETDSKVDQDSTNGNIADKIVTLIQKNLLP